MDKKEFDHVMNHSKRIKTTTDVHIRVVREGNQRKFFWIKSDAILLCEHKRENAYNQKEINKLVKKVTKLEKVRSNNLRLHNNKDGY